jgi:hypothetical protein
VVGQASHDIYCHEVKRMSKLIKNYIAEVKNIFEQDNYTEHTFRLAFKDLLEGLENSIIAVNEPKRIKCGAPDFLVSKKKNFQLQ